MQDVVAAMLGAGFVTVGFFFRYLTDKLSQPIQHNKEEQTQFSHMAFKEELLCGHIETVAADPEDPWGYQLEPCEEPALVIMGGLTLCERHRDDYVLEMSPKK